MAINAAGLDVAGALNPNWKGGRITKQCLLCKAPFYVIPSREAKAKTCSLACWNEFQQVARPVWRTDSRRVTKLCEHCKSEFTLYASWVGKTRCCSKKCSHALRAINSAGDRNANWAGGVSRLPYPWNFRRISRDVIARYGGVCQSPECKGHDRRMTTHHIDYDKSNNAYANLIALCSACNSSANSGRAQWTALYRRLKEAA